MARIRGKRKTKTKGKQQLRNEVKGHSEGKSAVVAVLVAVVTLSITLLSAFPYLSTQFEYFRQHQKFFVVIDIVLTLVITLVWLMWILAPDKLKSVIISKKKTGISLAVSVVVIIPLISIFPSNVFTQQLNLGDKSVSPSKEFQEPPKIINESEENNYLTPEVIRQETNSYVSKRFTPIMDDTTYNEIFIVTRFKVNQNYLPGTNTKLDSEIEALVSKKIETQNEDNYDVLNGNKLFTSPVEQAKTLAASIDYKKFDANKYSEIISLRENAYSVGKTRALALVIAQNYCTLGRFYAIQNIKEEAVRNYIKAIDKYYDVISLTKKNGRYQNNLNDILYYIGQVFHSIGDIKDIDTKWREEAFLMSSSYLEYSYSLDDTEVYSEYFAGMVNHKLGIVSSTDCKTDYLLDAEKFYLKCLKHNIKKRTKINLYKFTADVYRELGAMVTSNPQIATLRSAKEYSQLKDGLLSDVKKLESKSNL